MKKLFLVMLTVAMATCFVACKTDGAKPADAQGSKPATEQQQTTQVKEVSLDEMKALVEKAKTEGKDWSVDQWKEATRTMMMGLKPMFDALADFQKKTEDPEAKKKLDKDPAEAAKMMADLAKQMEQFKPMEQLMNEFEEVSKNSTHFKEAEADTVWFNNMVKELGLPEEAFK